MENKSTQALSVAVEYFNAWTGKDYEKQAHFFPKTFRLKCQSIHSRTKVSLCRQFN